MHCIIIYMVNTKNISTLELEPSPEFGLANLEHDLHANE
jgi:hypothetical protein